MPDSVPLNVLPRKPGWADRRLAVIRHNEFAHRIEPPRSIEEWTERRDRVRHRVMLSAGLIPFPDRTPLEPDVGPWQEYEHCRIATVSFESRPGLHVTGNLYAPVEGAETPCPGILCPHGHWPRGRLHHDERGSVPARCMMLARLGFVVFSYDMIGYNDCTDLVHRLPPDLARRAGLCGISMFGLQLWNSIRATDFLSELPMVDPARIGCTGASGGASQTWNLAIVDDRIAALAPVCMLSAHFQGGCPCEEGPLLRVDDLTSVDVLMAMAPRPLLLPSVTGDWTSLNPVYEVGLVKDAYRLWGAEDRVEHVHFDDQHNYNRRTREVVYAWFVKWLRGDRGVPKRIPEPDVEPPNDAVMRIQPPERVPTPRQSNACLNTLCSQETRLFSQPPESVADWRELRQVLRPLYSAVFEPAVPPCDVAVRVTYGRTALPQCTVAARTLSRRGVGDVIPALWIPGPASETPADVAVVIAPGGKSALFENNAPIPLLQTLLDEGLAVLTIDMLGTGETEPWRTLMHDDREDMLWYAFNPSFLCLRIQDVLTAVQAARETGHTGVHLLALGEAARVAALAAPMAGPLASVALDLEGVDLSEKGWQDDNYQPFVLKAGGLRGALTLASPTRLLLRKPPQALDRWTRQVYRSCGREPDLTICRKDLADVLPEFLSA